MSNLIGVPAEVLYRLNRARSLASKTSGTTAHDSENRLAGDKLAADAERVIRDYDVSVYELSLALGLSKPALKLFLDRRRTVGVTKEPVCQRGHDLMLPAARTKDGKCRECVRLRKAKYRSKA